MSEEASKQTLQRHSPPTSRSSSTSSRRSSRRPSLSLDLSDLPPLVAPSPPSNTLIITNLRDPAIFNVSTLAHLRELITQHLPKQTPDSTEPVPEIHSFSPIRTLSRIIVSFTSIEAAIHIRSLLDGANLFDERVRVYFGEPTPLNAGPDRLLKAPRSQKQFFISPPPSPPAGWSMRDEDPPNRAVHAQDLAVELQALENRVERNQEQGSSESRASSSKRADDSGEGPRKRSRSSSIMLYQPEDHGSSAALPAIALEDTTTMDEENVSDDEDAYGTEGGAGKILAHTARPPVELMADT